MQLDERKFAKSTCNQLQICYNKDSSSERLELTRTKCSSASYNERECRKMKNTNKTNKETKTTTKTNNLRDVTELLNSLEIDTNKYYSIRCYDNEEFNTVETYRKEYACIKEKLTQRVVIKLWGHKDFVACECSKMLRKKEQINVEKKLYTSKELDENNNYICKSLKDATALCKDFIAQVDKYLYKETTVTKTTKDETKTA